jgi:hypothetical protein
MRSPVLFLIFNRPECTRKVFETIRAAKPPRIYVAADGPRDNRPREGELCEETRSILKSIDWPCEINTLFRDKNLGCKQAVSRAIDWFFHNEEEGVVLEDDCLPRLTFFAYCDEMLEFYRDNPKVGFIAGVNFQGGRTYGAASYYFSKYPHIWGWASWRRSWALYDRDASVWPEFRDRGGLERIVGKRPQEIRHWLRIFEKLHAGKIDTWDYQVTLAAWAHDMVAAIPQRNLVSNIGFGPAATHTIVSSSVSNLATQDMIFPLTHPSSLQVCEEADRWTASRMYRLPFFKRIIRSAGGSLLSNSFGRFLLSRIVR